MTIWSSRKPLTNLSPTGNRVVESHSSVKFGSNGVVKDLIESTFSGYLNRFEKSPFECRIGFTAAVGSMDDRLLEKSLLVDLSMPTATLFLLSSVGESQNGDLGLTASSENSGGDLVGLGWVNDGASDLVEIKSS